MPSLWEKPSSIEEKRKTNRRRFINSIHWKIKQHFGGKKSNKSGGSQRYPSDTCSEKGIDISLSALPSLQVSRCQSFSEEPHAQPLPLPVHHSAVPSSLDAHRSSKPSSIFSGHGYDLKQPLPPDVWGDLATASVSSNSSIDTNDQLESQFLSPQASDYDSANVTAVNSPSRHRDHASILSRRILKDQLKPVNLPSGNHMKLASSRKGPFGTQVTKLQISPRAGYFSAPGSYISSPSRSPVSACSQRPVKNSPSVGKLCSETNTGASGHCPCSSFGLISGHNPVGDMSSISPQNMHSPDHSPILSPRMPSPSRCSCRKNGSVTPLHPWPERLCTEFSIDRADNRKTESHKLPLPPTTPSCSSRPETSVCPASCWKKGRLVGSGTFGHVYLGFNSDTGEMCAIKEVTLFADDAKSKESAQQLGQEITMLSCLQHPNIVRYFGSEMVDNKLLIYLEYVSGGSIHKLLQEFGQLSESAIRRYTRQILCGLAYLHSKNTVHRDIKGANILVDPSGQVKLADFGMAKHVTDSCPLSFKGSPYWMAPEIIKKSCGNNLAVDIWSLGCTVIEMWTTKPPWSQYEGVAALFKIGNSKELPAIPDSLSDEGKDFISKCLQRNPLHRPTAVQLLDHPFVRGLALPERCVINLGPPEPKLIVHDTAKNKASAPGKTISSLNLEGVAMQLSRDIQHVSGSSNPRRPKHVSCPVSPIGSPLLQSKSSKLMSRRMPPPISSSNIACGSSMTCANGNIAFRVNQFDHSLTYPPEGMGARRPQKSVYTCGTPLYGKTRMEMLSRIPEISRTK